MFIYYTGITAYMTTTHFFQASLKVLVVYEIHFEKFYSLPQKKDVRTVRYFKSIMAVCSQYDKTDKGMITGGTGPSHQSNMCLPNKKYA